MSIIYNFINNYYNQIVSFMHSIRDLYLDSIDDVDINLSSFYFHIIEPFLNLNI